MNDWPDGTVIFSYFDDSNNIFADYVHLLFRPECLLSSDCELRYACVNQKCADPCPGTCGANAECKVSIIYTLNSDLVGRI